MSVMEGRMSEPELPDAAALSRVVAVINGKGGVLKTSIVANVAGCLAKSMRVLVIDLDISGNLKMDLGMTSAVEDDAGKSVVDAVWSGADLARGATQLGHGLRWSCAGDAELVGEVVDVR